MISGFTKIGYRMDKKFFEGIIAEIKNLRGGTMAYIFIISVLCFLLDLFLLRHIVAHTLWLDFFRSIYFLTGFFSNIFLFDSLWKTFEIKQEMRKAEKIEKQKFNEKVNNLLVLATPTIKEMPNNQKDILKTFIQYKSLEIALQNNEHGYSNIVVNANLINAKLFGIGLNILIDSTFTHTLLKIDNIYYEVLKLYFEDERS